TVGGENMGIHTLLGCLALFLAPCATPSHQTENQVRRERPMFLTGEEIEPFFEPFQRVSFPTSLRALSQELDCDFEKRHLGRYTSFVGKTAMMHTQLTPQDDQGRYYGMNIYSTNSGADSSLTAPTIFRAEIIYTYDPY